MLAAGLLAACLSAAPADTPPKTAPKATPPKTPVPAQKKPDEAEQFFKEGLIPRLRIEIAEPELDALRQNNRAYVKCTIKEVQPNKPDKVYTDVGIHLKGAAGSFRDLNDKPALTLNFDKFHDGQKFHGLDKMHLNNSVQDGSYLCENVASACFREAGIPTPRASHARVMLNGRDLGFFVLKEGFDAVFLKRFFNDSSGILWDGGFVADIDANLQIRHNPGNKEANQLKELIAVLGESDPTVRRDKIGKLLDTDRFITFLAIEAMLGHWDGYGFNRNNYRIYYDAKTEKLVFLPHGMDQLFQQPDFPLVPGAGMVARAMLQSADDRAKYLERIAQLREKVFTPEALSKHIEAVSNHILPALAEMDKNAARDHRAQAADLHRRIVDRVRSIDRQLGSQPKPLKFDKNGIALVGKQSWDSRLEAGNGTFDQFKELGNKIRLRIRPEGNGGCAGSFRTSVLLEPGQYTFEGRCRPLAVVAGQGQNTGVGLRVSGGQRDGGLTGSSDWKETGFDFEVTDPSHEVVLVCELRASKGAALFDLDSLRLRKR
jgi:hypothetical protein